MRSPASQINQSATMLKELTGSQKPLNARRYFPVLDNDEFQPAKTSQ
jgi:hypothetical protein